MTVKQTERWRHAGRKTKGRIYCKDCGGVGGIQYISGRIVNCKACKGTGFKKVSR